MGRQNFNKHKNNVAAKKVNTKDEKDKELIKSKEIENSALKKILDQLNKELNA